MNDLRVPDKRFRPELEGVRAVAALLVAVYHIWFGTVSGGVDVFFIVSGFLITTSLLSRLERTGTIQFGTYLLGLMRRLFPLAFFVMFVTIIFSYFYLPQSQWSQMISEVFASALYFQNWELATNSVDYLAQNNEASPLQHFWALSIQGQFYITWPLIILLAYFLAKKLFKQPVRKTLLSVLITIFLGSFAYSVYITTVNQPWAYFDTFARVWEFSIGGILALTLSYFSLHRTVSFILGWLGLLIIAFTGMVLPVSDLFPGYAALLPISGVIFILIAAENGTTFGVQKVLGSKPFVYFGSISYAFYLWHWPILIMYFAITNNATVSFVDGLLLLGLSLILSVISGKIIESPTRSRSVKTRKDKGKVIAMLAVFMIPVFIANGGWQWQHTQVQQSLVSSEGASINDFPGAQSVSHDVTPNPDIDPMDRILQASEELPSMYDDSECYTGLDSDRIHRCSFGETEDPDYRVALVGGSHSGHWFPALEEIAGDLNMQIDTYIKDGCRFTTDNHGGALTDLCVNWNEHIIQPLIDHEPDLIVTTANANIELTPEGFVEMWENFEGKIDILALRDNQRMDFDVPQCLEQASDSSECATPRDELLTEEQPWDWIGEENIPSNVHLVDLTDHFCVDGECLPIIGNVITLRDNNHISTLYARTLGPALREELEPILNED
ncbi:acyltransferase family protein [Geomicrobium sediminis]|uniref:Peptidoglycan/LPS O-acetylase OafA/YrhL n=1 Tax=Geomicrobium sediminis TaxID=1347788 RepID=A0ABS2P7X4_9BACL|nr:acyltransferase family protein [Geomicrobium sediminis]MBM7631397.1 peptidoglycan/LPS O-acetylase OafA/YrhL [Geomicrobium sediminis]